MKNNTPIISAIAAMDENRGIGKNNKLPWNIPEDLAHFKKLTLGHPCIMGRNTYDSIIGYLGKPLPGRTSVVLNKGSEEIPGAITAQSIEEAIQKASEHDSEEIFITGGAMAYATSLPLVQRLYLTIIHTNVDADTFFPDYSEFTRIISKEDAHISGYDVTWLTLERPEAE